ncbi:MAG: citryl-CoA lyase [Pseudomonadales bacterium]|nr:citryl-CoA lyase [Pseudomonadales bacterium]
MSQDLKFVTAVSGQTSKGLILRKEKLSDLIKEADFVSTLYLSITGRKPKKTENLILNALLVASIDHGISPASGLVPRIVASSGGDIYAAMATSILSLGPYHGGAVTGAMNAFNEIDQEGDDVEKACENLIYAYRLRNERIPGFGHPIYKKIDPRAKILFELARKNNLDIQFMNIAKQLEHTLEDKFSKKLVLNIDGAMAALLLTINVDPSAGNAIFGLARVAGSIAHIIEEQQSGKWVRRLKDEDVEYAA